MKKGKWLVYLTSVIVGSMGILSMLNAAQERMGEEERIEKQIRIEERTMSEKQVKVEDQARIEVVALRQFQFKKMMGVQIPVLSQASFQQHFAMNPDVPKTNEAVRQLARRLYSSAGRAQIQEECGEYVYGCLFAALSNPDISDETRDEVDADMDADTPSLPQTYTSGHFKFYYTTSDSNSDNNVTLADIQATAVVLNNAWNSYATNFKEPKHYVSGGQKLIDVKVYYLGSTLNGVTDSGWNHIELNSKTVVKNACKRQTTPVHELFHRVQYAYGYITGTSDMKWATEGTASWSQKYLGQNVGDWMSRMNEGLQNPDRKLMKNPDDGGRSYDACHFWVYLGQKGNGEKESIKLAWATYQTNGKNMKNAVETVIKTRVPNGVSVDQFVGWWNFTNYYKDVSNASAEKDYVEDEWTKNCGGTSYGPLDSVPTTNKTLNVGTNYNTNAGVSAYGADYYVFTIGATVKKVQIDITAASKNFGYAVIQLKNNVMQTYQRTAAGGYDNYSFTKTLTPGQLSHIVLVVIGNPGGGNYSVSAKGSL